LEDIPTKVLQLNDLPREAMPKLTLLVVNKVPTETKYELQVQSYVSGAKPDPAIIAVSKTVTTV
jgi:hypothetical protein